MTLKSLFATVVVSAFTILPAVVLAQGPGGGGGDPDPAVPIDGGISLLIAAGVGYACKKAYDKRKKENVTEEKEVL